MTAEAIWILGDLRTERLWNDSLKVLTKALPLAEAAEAPVAMVLIGAKDMEVTPTQPNDAVPCMAMATAAAQAAASGAGQVLCVTHEALALPRTDIYAQALADLVSSRSPWLVLMPLNDFGREIAAFCAQHCQAGVIADCETLRFDAGQVVGRCPAWGGQILADITLAEGWSTAFVTVQPHGVKLPEHAAAHGEIEYIELDQLAVPNGMTLMRRQMEPVEARRLEDAHTVVVGGAGLGDIRGFGLVRELAAAMGAEVGATRPPVLHHWVEEERLIGQTGKSVRPRLLISIGTSGAIQYTAGITEADTIVAINRDADAPIFALADIGMVADAATVLPLLTQQAKQSAMRRLADAACYIDDDTQETPEGGFGAMVSQLREARGWSAEVLAQKTGQTPDFIQQVEADQMSPPVAFIMRMAQAMEMDPGTFLNKDEQAAIRDRRAQAHQQRTQNYSYTTLTPDEESHLRAFMVTIEPQLAHKPVAYKHDGEEFIFVMAGDLELTLGSKVQILKAGESIHFNSDVPHKLKSVSNEETKCLVVLYTI